MTDLEEIKRQLYNCNAFHQSDKLIFLVGELLEICKEQNSMLSRFSQDSEAYNQGKADLAREFMAWTKITPEVTWFTAQEWIQKRVDPSVVRPHYEAVLDKLWEAKKAVQLLNPEAFGDPFQRDILTRLVHILTD